jgi:hypothetical protein
MAATMNEQIVEVDSRRRISLGRIGRSEHTRYLAHVEDDGTIVLTPAVVVSAVEAKVLANPALVAKIQQALGDESEVEVDRSR